jgi:ABC-type polysaccharide/polyol phosphate transport system ATPase subunit
MWALQDVSFQVGEGEVVGIIGRNGAGKSTLLKILSRITTPSAGYADVGGRVGALLEVGTGFHPELTGRENIYLNGAILGMGRKSIERKMDQIVEFSGVERFLETPVKRYSSGMYLRLAFAVAAHMDSDVLLVDEVLAVGDASFQKKCLGQMESVASGGRTILFVSHNMGAVRALCQRGIFLDEGRVAYAGDLSDCVQRYFRAIGAISEAPDRRTASGPARTGFGQVRIEGNDGYSLLNSEPLVASTTLTLAEDIAGFYLFCIVEDLHGTLIFHLQEASPDLGVKEARAGSYPVRVEVPALWLNPGMYSLHFKAMLWGSAGSRYVSDKFPLDVNGEGCSASNQYTVLHPPAQWDVGRSTVARS